MSIFKKPYEISVWEDRLTLVGSDEKEYDSIVPEGVNIRASYFKEVKLCVIGSDSMKAPIRAMEPQLKREINGQNTLTFSIYSKYYDEEKEEFIDNPFVPFLVNERKIKLKFYKKNKIHWLDLIIKNIEESSEEYKYTYTATDLFINELSKTGINLVFDQELENNQGTVNELGAAILKGTDWQIGEDSEIIQQYQEEALYKIILNEDIVATNILTNAQKIIPKDEIIYGFYTSVVNQNYDFFQFIYNDNGIYLSDDNRVIYDASSYFTQIPIDNIQNGEWPDFIKEISFTNEYRGERIVRYQETTYDKILEKYVEIFVDDGGNEIYGYQDPKYITEHLARNYITNGQNFLSAVGWQQNSKNFLSVRAIPSFEDLPGFNINRISTLKYAQSKSNFLFNSGFNDNLEFIEDIFKDEAYMFRIKCGTLNENLISLAPPKNIKVKFQIKSYKFNENGTFANDDESTKIIVEGFTENSNIVDSEGYFFGIGYSKFSISKQELTNNNYGIFITILDDNTNKTYYIQDVQLFKYILDKNNNVCLPNGSALNLSSLKIEDSFSAYAQNYYHYYYPNQADSKEEIEYIYIGEKAEKFKPKYTTNFEKIRSITASETNRFDLLQTLSETFECWCRFEVKHKDTGEILLGRDIVSETLVNAGDSARVMSNYETYVAGNSKTKESFSLFGEKVYQEFQQQKFVTFHKNIGQVNNIDFVYGINLKSINRTLESDNIISKLSVKNNSNEFAPYGSCSVSRATENLTGENFIYDFSYYIKKGLLNYENLYNDLYSLQDERQWIGYYTKLKKLNTQVHQLIEKKTSLLTAYNSYNAEYQAIKLQYDANIKTLKENEEHFYELTQYTYDTINADNEWFKEKTVIALSNVITNLQSEIKEIAKKLKQKEERLDETNLEIKKIEDQLLTITSQKEKIILTFEKKYSRFIQEGPWTSEDYIDDNLYYLDADSTLHNSSQPKVEYVIKVIEISQIQGYENYVFELGDITHIQDTEFFGWNFKNNFKTPYREKIVVTEQTINFDSPEKDTIKVQNYRTQFEDLFQRLTASTQKIEFYSGAYNRAANIVNLDGSVKSEALEEAFLNNTNILKNANNNSVVWDEKGIITRNLSNLNEIVRITGGGIYLTSDGGTSWTTGITGQGINAKTITTGQLNTNNITILNGKESSFRWDSLGISAYYRQPNGRYDNKTYVRFDQFGIYGIKDSKTNFQPQSEEEVWNNANFALTWKGFMLRSSGKQGTVFIDNEKDFNILDSNEQEIIRIGRLDSQGVDYGIRIKDANNNDILLANQKKFITGGWAVEPGGLYSSNLVNGASYEVGLFSKELTAPLKILNSEEKTDWRIVVNNSFGVDFTGHLYASNANISGTIVAEKGRIGGIDITEEGLVIPRDRVDGLDITDENGNNLFFAYRPGKMVAIGPWVVTSQGLTYINEVSKKIINLSNEGINIYQSNEANEILTTKSISWEELVDKINSI